MSVQRAPQQAQIAQQVEDFMPHRLIVETQCGFQHPGAVNDDRILIVGVPAQPRCAHRRGVLLEDEGARRRDLLSHSDPHLSTSS